MSTSGIKLMCSSPQVELALDGSGVAVLNVSYRAAPIVNGFDSGGVRIPVGNLTETELNAQVQQAIMDQANASLPGENFTLSDVLGGRS
jgi:hypothetical protein